MESELSAVYCETHLPRCSITVYAARVHVGVCVLNGSACYLSSSHRTIVSDFAVFSNCVVVSDVVSIHLDNILICDSALQHG